MLDNEQPNGNESHKGNVYGITNADNSTDHRFQYETAVMCEFNCEDLCDGFVLVFKKCIWVKKINMGVWMWNH